MAAAAIVVNTVMPGIYHSCCLCASSGPQPFYAHKCMYIYIYVYMFFFSQTWISVLRGMSTCRVPILIFIARCERFWVVLNWSVRYRFLPTLWPYASYHRHPERSDGSHASPWHVHSQVENSTPFKSKWNRNVGEDHRSLQSLDTESQAFPIRPNKPQ